MFPRDRNNDSNTNSMQTLALVICTSQRAYFRHVRNNLRPERLDQTRGILYSIVHSSFCLLILVSIILILCAIWPCLNTPQPIPELCIQNFAPTSSNKEEQEAYANWLNFKEFIHKPEQHDVWKLFKFATQDSIHSKFKGNLTCSAE